MKYFVKSDWNGFFGLFTNNLTNVLVMATLLSVVVGMPGDIVYGRIIPAVGLSILLASVYYSYMAARLARRENRDDVTALPAGTSVPHMFLIVFLIIGPVYWATGNAYLAWSAGLVWALFEGLVELAGSFLGARVRKILPRAAMLGSLAGVSITYIALDPAFSIFRASLHWYGDPRHCSARVGREGENAPQYTDRSDRDRRWCAARVGYRAHVNRTAHREHTRHGNRISGAEFSSLRRRLRTRASVFSERSSPGYLQLL